MTHEMVPGGRAEGVQVQLELDSLQSAVGDPVSSSAVTVEEPV